MALSGRCLCGAVRYETAASPAFVGNCYCAACRRETGAGHATIVAVPTDKLHVTGALKIVAPPRAEDAAPIPRHFCPACGTTLFARPPGVAGMSMLRAGTLDDASRLKIEMSAFVAQAMPWDPPPADVPKR